MRTRHCTCFLTAAISLLLASRIAAAELDLRIDNPPTNGAVIALLFDSAGTFVGLRDPLKVMTLSSGRAMSGQFQDLTAGDYALMVYEDLNGNGLLDRNFIGIPREPLGFSNRYRPKGPPSFERAAFRLDDGETKTFDIRLEPVFGKRGLVGAGVGVIAQTSPYRDSDHVIVQPIPAISYIGDRIQILGPVARCGIANWGDIALAATAGYRVGAYEEKDSAILNGLGDRSGTLMGGLALRARLPAGCDLSTGYEHDLLNRTGGGNGQIGLGRAFQRGLLTVTPQVTLNWITAELADYEYGVPSSRARADRPAYHPGDALCPEAGLSIFRELNADWRILLTLSVQFLPAEITGSPLVGQSQLFSGFAAINRLF